LVSNCEAESSQNTLLAPVEYWSAWQEVGLKRRIFLL
jgi:hypothetical protein